MKKDSNYERIDSYILECDTIVSSDNQYYVAQYTRLDIGTFVLIFFDFETKGYKAIPTNEDNALINRCVSDNNAPIGYGWVKGNDLVTMFLFAGMTLYNE